MNDQLMEQMGQMTASQLLEKALSQPTHRKKKDFIESIRHKRLLYLDRAAFCEEILRELGAPIEEPKVEDMVGDDFPEPRRNEDSHQEEEHGKDENPEATRLDGGPDHRFKGNETQEIEDARRMRHGDDGRGEVRSEDDGRLKENESEAMARARHMEGGDDGRGEVKDEETDMRLKQNLPRRKRNRHRGESQE